MAARHVVRSTSHGFGVWDTVTGEWAGAGYLDREEAEAELIAARLNGSGSATQSSGPVGPWVFSDERAVDPPVTVEVRGYGIGRRLGTLTMWARRVQPPSDEWWGQVTYRTGRRETTWHSQAELHPTSEFG